MAALLQRQDIRDAHPTFDHLLSTHIAAGAAGSDVGEKLWDLPEGGINWAQYRFGTVQQSLQKPLDRNSIVDKTSITGAGVQLLY